MAAAAPPELPPGTHAGSHGFRVGPSAECSHDEPMANSSMFVLPSRIAPASSSRCTAVALNGERYPSSIFDEHDVSPCTLHSTSLIARGTPASGPVTSPRSTASARCSAASSNRST